MDDFALIHISNQCLQICITDDWARHANHRYFWKGIRIFPWYPILKLFIILFIDPLKPLLHGANEYISFLNMNNSAFTLSCDWCSIVNGSLEAVRVNLLNNPELLDAVDFTQLNKCFYFVDDSWSYKRITKHCNKLFGSILNENNRDRLRIITKFYAYAEYTEKRWCPFKRASKLYYRNKQYIDPTERNIYEFGRWITSNGPIECHKCNKLCNKRIKPVKTDNYVFQLLLDYIVK